MLRLVQKKNHQTSRPLSGKLLLGSRLRKPCANRDRLAKKGFIYVHGATPHMKEEKVHIQNFFNITLRPLSGADKEA